MMMHKITDEELNYYSELAKKDKNTFPRKQDCLCLLDDMKQKTELLVSLIEAIKHDISIKNYEDAQNEIYKIIRMFEKLTNKARILPLELGCLNHDKIKYDESVKSADIKFRDNNGILSIEMPNLLPRRTISSNDLSYIRQSCYNAFYEHFNCGKYKVYESKVVIVFTHYYEKHEEMRDNDNTETKVIIDLISMFTLIDDSPTWCDIYERSEMGDSSRTIIDVVPISLFINYLLKKNTPNHL